MKQFSVYTEFLEKHEVSLAEGSRVHMCLQGGGLVLCDRHSDPERKTLFHVVVWSSRWYIINSAIMGVEAVCVPPRFSVQGMDVAH